MGKYIDLQEDIFSVFDSVAWKAESINTYPFNFIAVDPGNQFIRVNILPSDIGVNLKSISGLLLIEVFVPKGNGPKPLFAVADKLDNYLVGKSLSTHAGTVTQFQNSSVQPLGIDKENHSLYRATYSIPFNYFGVQ
jgi:hypothetical protein